MWFPNAELLQNVDAGSAFLLLAWQEMFDPVTPDSYQPRLSHSASLVAELGATASKASSSEKWLKQVRVIQDELRVVADEEADVLCRCPHYAWAIDQLVSTAQSAKQLACLAKTLEEQNRHYDTIASDLLHESASRLPQDKEATMRALRRWATVAIQRTLSLSCLRQPP